MNKKTIFKVFLILTLFFIDLAILDLFLNLLSQPDTLVNYVGFVGIFGTVLINFLTIKKILK